MPVGEHWTISLPVVLVSFVLMVPPIMAAERRGRMKAMFIGAVVLMAGVHAGFAFAYRELWPSVVLLTLFFAALAAIAVAQEMGLSDDVIRRALAGFSGVKRRFTKTGEAHGITVIDDYGHHPVEIAATLRAARQSYGGSGRVIAIMQPHRFSRLGALKNEFATCFTDADTVFIADVYAAGEAPIEGVNRDMLVGLAQRAGHRDVHALGAPGDLPDLIWNIARPGDVVVCLGAGNITQWAYALPEQLAAGGAQ